nr:ABC transporter substrate-binding protein [uncultured Acetatifactor sp.]
MLKKSFAMLLAVVLSIGSLAGCTSSDPAGGSEAGNSTQSTGGTAAAGSTETGGGTETANGAETDAQGTALTGEIEFSINRSEEEIAELFQPIADRFMAENPGTTVTIVKHETDAQIARTQLNAGEHPDVSITPRDIPPSELSRYYLPLGSVEELSQTYMYAGLMSQDGQSYALPNGVTHLGMVYNKQVINEHLGGQVPQTLDEWYAAAETLKAAGITPLWTNAGSQWPMSNWDSLAIEMSEDPGYRNSLMTVEEPWTEGTPLYQMATIFETFVKNDWVEEDTVMDQWESSKSMLAEGKIGFMVLGSWAVPQMQDVAESMGLNPDDIGFAPIPYKNDVSSDNPLNVLVIEDMLYAINKDTESPELARAFLEYFLSSEAPALLGLSSPIIGGAKSEYVQDLASMDYVVEMQEDLPDDTMKEFCNELQLDVFIGGTYLIDHVLEPVKNGGENTLNELNELWSSNLGNLQ